MCFIRISEQTTTSALYDINRVVLYNRSVERLPCGTYSVHIKQKLFKCKELRIKGAVSSPSVCPHGMYRHSYQCRVSMFLISIWFRIFIVGTSVRISTRDVANINRGIRLCTLRTYGACTSRQLRFRSIDWSVPLRGLAVTAVRAGFVIEDSDTTSNIQWSSHDLNQQTVRLPGWLRGQLQDKLWVMWALRRFYENGCEWQWQDTGSGIDQWL